MTVDRKKLGKRAKRKGNAYELKIAAILSEAFGEDFRRVPASGGLEHLKGDICFNDFTRKMPIIIDTKDQKTLFGSRLKQEVQKSRKDAEVSEIPGRFCLVVHEHGTSNHYAVLPLELMIELLKASRVF